ncbi:MAG: hypothetical protein R3313_02000 [Candidatus Saccharimonadales bacterium]|nr:hypothetical protein [Candidatus Saccharimonadales bacterium]
MLFGAFLTWWYGRGWAATLDQAGHRMKILVEIFSIPILFKTLFSPWKQIVSVSSKDQALNIKMRTVIDNIISRFVGFWVRLIVLFTGLLGMLGAAIIGLIWIIAWPIIPLLIPILIVASTGLF